ncbi:MAG: rhodanese-like domain-containing protein [Burkholderiales bacterium]
MKKIVNIAAYKFVSLAGLSDRCDHLKSRCVELQLKGTILLAPEGINLFLAGGGDNIATFEDELCRDPAFADIQFKESFSDQQPFGKLRVKIKLEIIPFGKPEINPAKQPAERLSAGILKEWLDEGRDVVLLDTRNAFEIKHGTFKNAADFTIDNFRDFPRAAAHADPSLKEKTIVTFCTGGIRCEKAAPYLIQQGYQRVYQLDGGILKYFEACGKAHFEGDCFVFDERIALDAKLKPIETN